MQEHPVLDVLSATNHGGQAALFVCLVKLLITMSKNQVTCMTLKLTRVTKCQNSSSIAASENLSGCARQDIRFESGIKCSGYSETGRRIVQLVIAQFWVYTFSDRVDHHALFQKLLRRNLPPVVVRLLLSGIYQKQSL